MIPTGAFAAEDKAGKTVDSAFQVGENLYSTLDAAMNAGDTITLTKDATFTTFTLSNGKELTIDLMGHELSSTDGADITVSGGAKLTIQSSNTQGTLKMEGFSKANNAAIGVKTRSSVTLNGVHYTTDGTGLFPQGDAATVTVENCMLDTKGYCLGTNAGTSDNYRVKITLSNSTFNASPAEGAAGTAMYLNVPGTLEMDTCEVNGYMHGMFIRGGTATIKNSTITNTMDDDSLANYFEDKVWGTGNTVNLAALTLGDKSKSNDSSSYRYPTNVTLENTTVKMEGTAKDSFPAIYLYQMNDAERQVTLNITGDNSNYVGDISVNNKDVNGETTAKVSITGGTFADDVSAYVPDGYTCEKNTEAGTWTVKQYEAGNMVVESTTSDDGGVSAKLDGVYGNENTTIDSEKGSGESAPSGKVENGEITIDLPTQSGDSTTSASLEVTQTAAASLDDASGLTVKSDVGSVSLPKEALKKVAGAKSAVTISIQKETSITDKNVKAAYTVEVKDAEDKNLLPSKGSETNGTITITVEKPAGVSDNFQFWYVDKSQSSLLYLEELTSTKTEDGKMAVQIGHLSTIVGIDGNPPEGSIGVATVTTNGTTTNYSSLDKALEAVAKDGGTLKVLTNGEVTLTETLKIEKDVTITGSGTLTLKAGDGFKDRQKLLNMEANLTIDGAKVTLVPNVTGKGDAIQMGADTKEEITLTLKNGANLTIDKNKNEGFQNALVMPAGEKGKVVVDGSTLEANNIDGNFANGGVFEIKNGANVTIDDCESYGLSVNQLTVDGKSNVQVSNVQLAAIKTIGDDASVTVTGNSTVTVEKSGGKLPYGSKWGVAAGVVDIGHGNQNGDKDDGSDIKDTPARLTVKQGSSIILTDNIGKEGKNVNFVYLTTTGSIVNNGNVTAVKYEEISEENSDVYRIVYQVEDKVYAVVSAEKSSSPDNTVSFTEPDGTPSVEGFTFVDWEYPGDWTVNENDKSVTFTPGDAHEFTVNAVLEPVVYTITLNANGGTVDPSVVAADANGKLKDALPTPTREGYTFDGWFTDPEGGDKVTKDTVFSENATIYAHWTEDSDTDDRPFHPSHSSGGSTGGIGTRLPVADKDDTPAVTGFESDTKADLTVNGRYQFRITSLDGHTPVLTVNNSNFTVTLASQNGRDYFYVITCAGTPGSTAAVSVDGKYLLTATVGGSASGVVSDTTHPFTVAQGGTYQFRLTAAARPSFAAGSASFTVEYAGQEGNDYFYKVHAVGQAGDGCGFYINGEAQPVAVATIA